MTRRIYNTGLSTAEKSGNQELEILNYPTISVDLKLPPLTMANHQYWKESPYLVFMSKNGVRGFKNWIDNSDHSFDAGKTEIWAVGKSTSGMVNELLMVKASVPDSYKASGLIESFQEMDRKPVIIASSSISRPEFPEWLANNNWNFLQAVVYETVPVSNRKLRGDYSDNKDDIIFFSSPSTVDGFVKSIGRKDLSMTQARLATMGSTTSARVKELGGKISYESSTAKFSDAISQLKSMALDN